ncbi:MAG TPA: GLPGLI family protein [Saprospiraceae bacterium]|nr:GLPGLI family protein [Saprospiraceae bacterium]
MKYALLVCALLTTMLSTAQFSGKIIFEDKMDMHRNLPPEKEELKDMIPQFTISKWELTYAGDESLYQPSKEADIAAANTNPGGYRPRFGRENRILYKNLAEDKMTDSRDFMQKQFLVIGFIPTQKWKIGKNQKSILGYNCLEASCRIDSATLLKAWFTPQIANSNGPSDYQGLPGMIMQVDINDGERTITATNVTMENVDASVIIAPSKGKVITYEEFEAMRKEKMKELKLQQGGGGPVMYIRHN